MERVTFQRPDVKKLLAGMVCMKIDAGDGHPLASRFGVGAFPTLVLLEPTGEVLYKDAGAPAPEGFANFFAIDDYNALVRAYNQKDWKAAAPHAFFLRTHFGDTEIGKKAEELYEHARTQEGFAEAYEAARLAREARLEKERAKLRKEEARREEAKTLKAKADELYEKYLRSKSYKLYKRIILEYPDLPEAEAAREILRKHKQKWKEPK